MAIRVTLGGVDWPETESVTGCFANVRLNWRVNLSVDLLSVETEGVGRARDLDLRLEQTVRLELAVCLRNGWCIWCGTDRSTVPQLDSNSN
jgi:hypothetical protein